MDYAEQAKIAQDQLMGGSFIGEKSISEPALIRITERIGNIANEFRAISANLNGHADRVHGERPEVNEGNSARPVRCGALGNLEDAVDYLSESLSAVREAAERNCGLA